jgi:transcriptional regulator with XRE-family HTH domain
MSKPQTKLLKLGKRVADWRARRLMTVEALAKKAGISKSTLSDIENGKKDPRYLTLAFVAEALGITVATLLREL